MSDLVLEPAVRQLELLRSGKLSVAELAEAHIRQIERLNPTLNALVDFDAELVCACEARAMDAAPRSERGALFGLPVTVKSSIATAGFKCEIGSLLHKGDVPREDAVVVARLRAAGALILGTTNCPEFLMAYETDNLLHGQTRNPWDLDAHRRAAPVVASRRRSRPDSPLQALAAIVAARFACLRISRGSARSSPRPDAFQAAAICRRVSGRSRFSALSGPWRAPSPMCRCCFVRCKARTPATRPVRPWRLREAISR